MSNIVAESAAERLARLAQDALGAGSFEAIRRSINLAAGLPADFGITDQGALNDLEIIRSGDLNRIQARIRQIFENRGVPIEVPAGPPAVAPPPPQTGSAAALLRGTLEDYGLGGLADWAMDQLRQGLSIDQILFDLRDRPEFKARFPAIELRRQAGLTPLSPAEYIAYEQQARQILRQFGVPEGFYDSPSDLTELLANDVSVAELYERVQNGYQQVAYAAPEVREVFADYFGARGDNALAAFFIDPDRAAPVLRNMVTEAQIGGAGRQQGLMIDLATAARLRGTGVTEDEARQGFAAVRELDPLFTETVAEADDFTALGEGLAAVFNLDPAARRRLERRQAARLAAFQGGGGAAVGQTGVLGAGIEEPVI